MKSSILCMYISEKSGHHSATLSIEDAIHRKNPDVKVLNINGFKYVSPIMEKLINSLYMKAIDNFPQLWDFLYDNPAIEFRLKGLKENVNKKKGDKIKLLVEKNNCKVVVCSQAFPCGIVVEYKKRYFSELIVIAVVTDFRPHSYWIYDEVDYYVVASQCAKDILVDKGVKEQKIKVLGIPIRVGFSDNLDRQKVADELSVALVKPIVLVMGGSRGFGPLKNLIKAIDDSEIDATYLVVTGSNKRLYKWLLKKKKVFTKDIRVYAAIDYVDKLMTLADVIITKPGGITTAECITKKLPMIILKPIPGQEEHNTNYLLRKQMALKADSVSDSIDKLKYLLHDKALRDNFKAVMEKERLPFSSTEIAELALNHL